MSNLHSSEPCLMPFMISSTSWNCTLTISLLIRNNGKTFQSTLETFSLGVSHYNIWLNPHKCVFCVETRCLLGFVFSKDGTRIDPLKIVSILALPTPTNIIDSKVCKGRKTFFVVLCATSQRKCTVICVS